MTASQGRGVGSQSCVQRSSTVCIQRTKVEVDVASECHWVALKGQDDFVIRLLGCVSLPICGGMLADAVGSSNIQPELSRGSIDASTCSEPVHT